MLKRIINMRKFSGTNWIGVCLIGILLSAFTQADTITSVSELKTAWAAGGTHTITAGGSPYVLDADITCGTLNLSLTATGGAVTISGNSNFNIFIDDVDFDITGVSQGNPLSFTLGLTNTVNILSSNSAVTGTFTNCQFLSSVADAGLMITGALTGVVDVTCVNCVANNNDEDGFGIASSAVGAASFLRLNGCDSRNHRTDAVSDGYTAHRAGQSLIITNCTAFNNTKGVGVVGNNDTTSDGPALTINGLTVTSCDYGVHIFFNNIWTSINIDDLDVSGITNTTATGLGIWFDSKGTIDITNSIFKGTTTSLSGIDLDPDTTAAITATIDNCIFYDFTFDTTAALKVDTSNVVVRNCVFYNNDIAVFAAAANIDCHNSIISDSINSTFGAWLSFPAASDTYLNSSSNNNFFFNNIGGNFASNTDDELKGSDLTTNPGLTDPDNGDFTITDSSNAFEAGDSATATTTDILGVTRSDPPDVGAFEFVAAAPTGGADRRDTRARRRYTGG